ncbi:MAG: peptidoglycan DD-metalloendopeptidase family protein [Brevefilum sp.]|jgi:murein DD-endopeptidase MepM/ murein hydrolase activator NlpD
MTFRNKIIRSALTIIILLMFLLPSNWSGVQAKAHLQELPVYIVQQGDTLGTIALRFGVSVDDIIAENPMANPNALDIGQRLNIPGLEGVSGVLTSMVVPFGASLSGLTRKYQIDLSGLAYLNRITSPSEVVAGLRYIIPVKEGIDPFFSVDIISQGDTLLEQAINQGTSPWIIISENQFKASWDTVPGEIIFGKAEPDQEQPQLPGINSITFNNLPVIQGETMQVVLSTSVPASVEGRFGDQTFQFFSEDNSTYYGFHGIHALAEPGSYPFELSITREDGRVYRFVQYLLLAEGGYGDEWVTVPDEYLDKSAITQEDAYLQPILSQATPERFWEGQFHFPIDEPCVSSFFGQRRDYNSGGMDFYHTGLDFAVCAQNLNIYAPAKGKVVVAEELVIMGNAVIVDHGWGIFSGYAHLSEIGVKVGDMVTPGDILGQIGNTGRSAGPHLHFEIIISGTPVNPETWLTQEFVQSEP